MCLSFPMVWSSPPLKSMDSSFLEFADHFFELSYFLSLQHATVILREKLVRNSSRSPLE